MDTSSLSPEDAGEAMRFWQNWLTLRPRKGYAPHPAIEARLETVFRSLPLQVQAVIEEAQVRWEMYESKDVGVARQLSGR
jgi:hypothetical protein